MFDNFTCENQYHSYDVILASNEQNGALLLGDFNSATDQTVLSQHSVKTVITSAAGLEHLEIPDSVHHIVYPLKDAKSENIRAFFEQSFHTIDQKLQQGGVLVHCAAGVSRSATLIIAYLMKKNQMPFKEAINFVRSKRGGICPNLGFELQLKKYQTQLQKKSNKSQRQKPENPPQPKLMRKNVSEKINDDKKVDIDNRQLQNKSLFLFEPAKTSYQIQGLRKKPQIKKGTTKHVNFSKPKERIMYDVMETELFISGKAAKRPSSQVRDSVDKMEIVKKNPMMGTWGPKQHRPKKFQF